MRHLLSLATAVGLTLSLMTGGFAATAKPAATKAATKKATGAMKCPACGMTLSTKKTKANPKAVKIAGKTYYCCAAGKKAGPFTWTWIEFLGTSALETSDLSVSRNFAISAMLLSSDAICALRRRASASSSLRRASTSPHSRRWRSSAF